MTELYHYKIKPGRVIDGDTFEADIDLGFGAWIHKKKIRVVGCDAFELRAEGGAAAKMFTESVLISGEVVIHSIDKRFDSFGRVLARVYVNGRDLAAMLIEAGHAKAYGDKNA